jgi:hypothetical protein
MSGYHLTVITWSGSGVQFRQAETYSASVIGDVPQMGEILTVHPDGKPSERSFTCDVTGVQRVIMGDPVRPEIYHMAASVHVTGKINGALPW